MKRTILSDFIVTNLALGYSKSLIEEIRESSRSIIQVEISAFIMHIVFGVISFLLSLGQGVKLIPLIFIALSCNLLSFLIISLFALWSAHVSFERGLNPDNIVIPAITSLSDTTATIVVSPAIFLAQLFGL